MFDIFASIAAAWRTIWHVSEWTAILILAIVAGAFLVYKVPLARRFVVRGAVITIIGYVCLIHGDRTGRADVEAQWADARKAAIVAEHDRDNLVEHQLTLKYQPELDRLKREAAGRKTRAEADERKLATASKVAARNTCELGAAADRVPGRR